MNAPFFAFFQRIIPSDRAILIVNCKKINVVKIKTEAKNERFHRYEPVYEK